MVGMSEKHFTLLNLLGRGAENATRREDLSVLTGMSDREVRKILSDISVNGGVVICNTQNGAGYFLPARKEEVVAQMLQDDHRAKRILAKRRHQKALLKQMEDEEQYGQRLV